MKVWLSIWMALTVPAFFIYLSRGETIIRFLETGVASLMLFGIGLGIGGYASLLWDKVTRRSRS